MGSRVLVVCTLWWMVVGVAVADHRLHVAEGQLSELEEGYTALSGGHALEDSKWDQKDWKLPPSAEPTPDPSTTPQPAKSVPLPAPTPEPFDAWKALWEALERKWKAFTTDDLDAEIPGAEVGSLYSRLIEKKSVSKTVEDVYPPSGTVVEVASLTDAQERGPHFLLFEPRKGVWLWRFFSEGFMNAFSMPLDSRDEAVNRIHDTQNLGGDSRNFVKGSYTHEDNSAGYSFVIVNAEQNQLAFGVDSDTVEERDAALNRCIQTMASGPAFLLTTWNDALTLPREEYENKVKTLREKLVQTADPAAQTVMKQHLSILMADLAQSMLLSVDQQEESGKPVPYRLRVGFGKGEGIPMETEPSSVSAQITLVNGQGVTTQSIDSSPVKNSDNGDVQFSGEDIVNGNNMDVDSLAVAVQTIDDVTKAAHILGQATIALRDVSLLVDQAIPVVLPLHFEKEKSHGQITLQLMLLSPAKEGAVAV